MKTSIHATATLGACLLASSLIAQEAPSGSLVARALQTPVESGASSEPHALLDRSLFAVPDTEPRAFRKHDLVQIIVRESSSTKSSQELESEKEYDLDGSVSAWPDLNLEDLLQLRLFDGRSTNLPAVRVGLSREFEGEGEYSRRDDFSTRVTAEVVDVLPNGNLVLEARTEIQTDQEINRIRVTGICRGVDVTPSNTILSNQIHDLRIVKMHEGELKKSSERGLIPQFLDLLFAF